MKLRMYVLVGAAGFAAVAGVNLVSASASAEEPASCAGSAERIAAALFELPCCAPADWPVGLMPDGAWTVPDLDPCRELADRIADVWLSGHLPDGAMMSPFRM